MVRFLTSGKPDNPIINVVYMDFSLDEKEYSIRIDSESTILFLDTMSAGGFKTVAALKYKADITPKTAREFARRLLNLKAFL